MRFFFDFIFFLFAAFYFPYAVLTGKWHEGLLRRWGNFPEELKAALWQKKNVWIHAVSVGEIMAVGGLIHALKERFPSHGLVLSTVTKTGYELACARFGDDCAIIYAPLDFSWVVRKYIRIIAPKIYIAAETEIWPNLLMTLSAEGIPSVQVNGRISDKSFGRYRAVGFLIRRILRSVDLFCMQSARDAERIRVLGALAERVRVTGNMKFDEHPQAAEIDLATFGFGGEERIWVAGSTHPGEEAAILNIYKRLRQEFPELRLIIVPRHIPRISEISKLVAESGFEVLRFSESSAGSRRAVLIVDVIGQLRGLYRLAEIIFVGKSLTVHGGQNMIEPACFGKPVVTGPFTENFADVMRVFLQEHAIIQVQNEAELLSQIQKLLRDPKEAGRVGQRAREVVLRQQGATARTLATIEELIFK